MSSTLKTLNKGDLEYCGFCGPITDRISIGIYEIDTKYFVEFASHIIVGGFFGWNDVPEYVKASVKYINDRLKTGQLEKSVG